MFEKKNNRKITITNGMKRKHLLMTKNNKLQTITKKNSLMNGKKHVRKRIRGNKRKRTDRKENKFKIEKEEKNSKKGNLQKKERNKKNLET